MNLNIPKINFYKMNCLAFKSSPSLTVQDSPIKSEVNTIPVYGDSEIRTNPAQLSLFHMHDFHSQNVRMERAFDAANQFDKNMLQCQNEFFDKDLPVDKMKLCSGDMYLGEDSNETAVVNEFLNLSGILANTIGNHECDMEISEFSDKVENRRYRLLGANMHPDKENKMSKILSNSFIAEIHGNRYGVIGLVPVDMKAHMKRPEEVEAFNISDEEGTLKDLQNEIELLKQEGVNKIVLLSHLGLEKEQYIAQNVNDIDVILGGHTHHLINEVKEGENLFYSPKGEPVIIMQIGRDGEYIGVPNIKFNELGQIESLQYNVLKTDDFARNSVAKTAFENILGKPEIVGNVKYAEAPPKDIYTSENPHCDFVLDCLKSELGTDIAIMNSANIRSKFYEGPVDTRDLRLISPFANKMVVIRASEKEIVDSLKNRVKLTMESAAHRPGILQVSGLKYEFSRKNAEITSITFIDKNGTEHSINVDNPNPEKFYTIAADDYCVANKNGGLDLPHRVDEAIKKFDCDKDVFVADYLRKQDKPVNIVSDGRIKITD